MKIVIIGNGISGVTAARFIRKQSDHEITIVSSESPYFYSRTALMYIFMGHMKWEHTQPYEKEFWSKNKISLVQAHVEQLNFEAKTIVYTTGETLTYDVLILATGSKPAFYNWKGQDSKGVRGLYSLQDLEQIEFYAKDTSRAVIVGGGLIGVELAEMLHSRKIEVTFLVRETSFWSKVLPQQESLLVTKHIQDNGISFVFEDELDEIISNEAGRVSCIKTNKGQVIDCQFVGITTGVLPNISFLENSSLEINKGILVNEFLETNIKDVYAIGDCAEMRLPLVNRKAIEQVWYTGKIMGETVASTICGKPKSYNPGIWYNSAKFFDLEYQTYGVVKAENDASEIDFYWENNDKNKCLHFVFEKSSQHILGVNTVGIRLRHEMFDNWISTKKSISYVLEHLADANFDPEFYRTFEHEIIHSFNQQFGASLVAKKKSWKRIFAL